MRWASRATLCSPSHRAVRSVVCRQDSTSKPLVILFCVQLFASRASSRCKHDVGALSWTMVILHCASCAYSDWTWYYPMFFHQVMSQITSKHNATHKVLLTFTIYTNRNMVCRDTLRTDYQGLTLPPHQTTAVHCHTTYCDIVLIAWHKTSQFIL